MFFHKQIAAEVRVVTVHLRPQIEAAVRALYIQHRFEDRQHRIELFAVQVTVGQYMGLVLPGSDAG